MKNTEKNKKFPKFLIYLGLGMLALLLLIRLISISRHPEAGLAQVNIPEEDVHLPDKESRIDQFENDTKKAEERQYHYSENPLEIKDKFQNVSGTSPSTEASPAEQSYSTKQQTPELYTEDPTRNQKKNNPSINTENSNSDIVQSGPIEVSESPSKRQIFGTVYTGSSSQSDGTPNSKEAYKAVLHSDQKIGNGQAAIFRNTEAILLPDGIIIPANSILYGQTTYRGDRVDILITRAITGNKEELVVSLDVYDNDYIKGVFFKSAVDKGVENGKDNSVDQAINGTPMNGAAKLGVRLLKGAVQSTNQTIKNNRKLTLEEGYIVYLKPSEKYKR